MKNRPNLFWHMMSWGLSSGFVLGLSFVIIMINFGDMSFDDVLFYAPIMVLFVFITSIAGVITGFFLAMILRNLLMYVSLPLTKAQMNQHRISVYGWTFISTFLVYILVALPSGHIVVFTLSPLIAAIAASYVAHRYMYRLRLWSGGMEHRKSRAKNDALAASRLSESNSPVADEILYSNREEKKEQL